MNRIPSHQQDEAGLDRALQSVTESLGKTDTKAAILLGTDTALASFSVPAALSGGPVAVRAVAGVAVGLLVAAIVVVVLAVLPRLDDDGGTSFVRWAQLSPEEIREAVREDARPGQVGTLSRLAALKFRRLRAACVLTGCAAVCLLVATVVGSFG
ncbi:Pycsar system effector family protein [Streptomyces mobaraensis]|uniref:Pycsar system effector family protein n=1 Tax=Streptomyces mobaraensis TaxID=35621 RepID=UPI00332DEF2E